MMARETYQEKVDAMRRRLILDMLEASTDYRASADLVQLFLADQGLGISATRVVADLEWLAEKGLVGLDDVGGAIFARLTPDGHEVWQGLRPAMGVARPRP